MNKYITVSVFLLISLLLACTSSKQAQDRPVSAEENIEIAEELDEAGRIEAEKLVGLIGFYLGRHRFVEALEVVQEVVVNYPETEFSDNAFYLKGIIYSHVFNYERDLKKAAAAYRMVIDSLPETEFDKKAQEELDKIKTVSD
ncbi:tol-pal system YbgF family protein [candidate division KSB1 bacterium]